jgi:hypothetical protein
MLARRADPPSCSRTRFARAIDSPHAERRSPENNLTNEKMDLTQFRKVTRCHSVKAVKTPHFVWQLFPSRTLAPEGVRLSRASV